MENAINHEAINQINSKILDNIKKKELEQKNEKTQFCYSIDWLTFNIKLKDINNPFIRDEGIYAEEREQGTNIFKRVKDFYNTRDELIFTIVFQPHSKIIKQDFGQLQIANKWLYVGNLSKLVYKIFFQLRSSSSVIIKPIFETKLGDESYKDVASKNTYKF